MPISYQELSQKMAKELTTLYPENEASTLVEWLLEHHLGLRRVDMLHFLEEKDLPNALKTDLERLKTGEPIQYILGHGPFYGREFEVTRDTLIPRNETEELVHLIIKENPGIGKKILDIGTGTGCIPITLNLEMKESEVFGLDVSEKALEVAKRNAKRLHSGVNFLKCDILNELPAISELDILVSNPPYVPQKDQSEMHRNVVDFEPHLALFVPDEDPLIFYRVIGEKGKSLLKKGGRLYFEIYEKAAKGIKELLEKQGYDRVTVHSDLNGKERMITATSN
ncbi:peptide chain release factor N(5)-glutamine methyltransferase [Algoriphagus sp. AK58]|nr:peptide chain release factor N(5)-glutamine methyltransferase [Algoriphagus sp. AK58]MBC6368174.1 peptide chain release factor N(5)-glutamine methyltransferase [Algoriphagus sp. AK58]